jgi:lysine-ketoglutarate reductase/saccharopine dehydrogenase-like protein (TIGR00300 family)
MQYELPRYRTPDFLREAFTTAPDARLETVVQKGVAPDHFHANTIFPEYFKLGGAWHLAIESRMDCVTVAVPAPGGSWLLDVKEFRRLESGDLVVIGRTEDASEGIFVHVDGFRGECAGVDAFAFRTGRSRETSYSRDYDRLYELLRYEKEHGHVVWVLGPAAVFDSDSRSALVSLIGKGYVHAVFGGNALATHDMEGEFFRTALGQDIYTQVSLPNGHYNHLDVINAARRAGSLKALHESGHLRDGVVSACLEHDIPLVLAGSIRDDGPLPGVIPDAYAAQDAMRAEIRKATTVLGLATQLHSIATGNMTPSYRMVDGALRPVYIYSVDVSEFAVNKLRDRGTLEVTSIVTNIQDFLVNLERNLS